MRRLVPLLVLALVALACAAVALAGSGDPKRAITKADQARAKSMLLTRADLPGSEWKATPSRAPDNDDLECPGFEVDESDLTLTGDATSPDFVNDLIGPTVSSNASVYRTAAQAQASWKRTVRPGLARCLEKIVRDEATANLGQTAKLAGPSVRRVAFPQVAPRTAAYRLTLSVTGEGVTVRAYFDFVLLGSSRANGGVFVLAVLQPYERATEVRLARLVAGRMAKAFT